MTDNELLLAISDMMDTKLKAEIQPLKNELQSVKGELQSVKGELQSVKNDVQSVKNELQSAKNEVQSVKGEVHQIKLCQENVILPRLQTIESCYTDTYSRYKDYADKMEAAFVDMDLLKKVVSEHSEKLQKLA